MKPLKEFEYYLEKGIVKKQSPDLSRARDLINESERKLDSLNLILDKIGILDSNANDLIESCYDIKKTMCHPHLKVWVCDRHLFLGCSKIEDK